jgi:hypothetical protein
VGVGGLAQPLPLGSYRGASPAGQGPGPRRQRPGLIPTPARSSSSARSSRSCREARGRRPGRRLRGGFGVWPTEPRFRTGSTGIDSAPPFLDRRTEGARPPPAAARPDRPGPRAPDHASSTRAETLALHRKNAAAGARVMRGLDGAALARSGTRHHGSAAAAVEQAAGGLFGRRIDEHRGSIRATVAGGRCAPAPPRETRRRQAAPALGPAPVTGAGAARPRGGGSSPKRWRSAGSAPRSGTFRPATPSPSLVRHGRRR